MFVAKPSPEPMMTSMDYLTNFGDTIISFQHNLFENVVYKNVGHFVWTVIC